MKRGFKTKYGKTEMKCINLVATGDTLVVAPNYKKSYTYVILNNRMIAEEIASDKKMRSYAFQRLKESYNEKQRFLKSISAYDKLTNA